ncbi:1,2-phenylacetyl-CoA epoxidase subunit PaaC [Saccharopolyspora flava]|uniref:Ring-1,2-phenylacetyl-CoA epoxidase subunit PaaC n=1 Tax=Saccharopolyspora flava TaxID=95161 RepID=A0A1I6PQU5_9PSEU|nr:1,2-phenylacetyl-CoA epoxidase subunit PaaC [Saccharopolyspora flava]SFS42556.1 ring-1,2-phenylacetyl-CoA epoxidase subunit PaaC [Saccharopolyspora flava]
MREHADLAELALRLGDDALILGQRLCEWITRAPMIEEDLALSNIALDLLGHARVLLSLGGELDGSGRDEDDLAFGRTEREFRNALLVELPNGDFAVTIARQLVFAHHAVPFYERLAGCADAELAAFAARAAAEVAFHRRHATDWAVRLGLGTEESARRMQAGLERVWPYAAELVETDPVVERLVEAGLHPKPEEVREVWHDGVADVLARAGLTEPKPGWHATGGRSGVHTEGFGSLVAEMQSVRRQFPGGTW